MPHKTVQKRKSGSPKKEAASVEDIEAEKESSAEKSGHPEETGKSAAPGKSSKVPDASPTALDVSTNEEKTDKLEESHNPDKTMKNSSSDTSSAEKDKARVGNRASRRTKHKKSEGEADISSSDIVELDNEGDVGGASSDTSGARKASKSQSKETSNPAGKITSGKPGRPPKRKAASKDEPEAIDLLDDDDHEKKGKRNLQRKGTSKPGSSTETGEDDKSDHKRRKGDTATAPSIRKSNRNKQATNYIEIDVSDEEKEADETEQELEKTKPLKKRKNELKSKPAGHSKKSDPAHDESSDELEVLSENICKSSDELVVLSENISSKKGRRRSSRSPKIRHLKVSNRPSRNTPVKRYIEVDEDSDE